MGSVDKGREITIVELVNNSATSVRLKSCINTANKKNQLPIETIGAYLDAGVTAKDKLLKIKNFGRKTADELVSIIEKVCTKELPKRPNHIDQIRNIAIVDLVNKYEMSNRLKNRIMVTKGENKTPFPFETIGDYLDAGITAEDTLLRLKNFGRKTAVEFFNLIETLTKELPKPPEPEKNVDVKIEPITEDEVQLRNTSIVDLVNKYAISARLKNCINVANEKNQLPFVTIGDYLDAGIMARDRLLEIHDLGRKTSRELFHLIEAVQGTALSDNPKNKKRFDLIQIISEQYPGVFDPLIEKYSSTPEEDKLGLEKLEAVLLDLCDKKSRHSEMVWFRFSGETLAEIGRSYGITRERVRQITARYKNYLTDTSSKSWAEKSVRHLVQRINNGNILPNETQLNKYHPKLVQSLISNFSTRKKGKLKPERRFEIAKALQLDIDYELAALNTWPLEKVIFEVCLFAKDLGHPDLMPMQKEMIGHARQDLRGAVGRHGGQSLIAKLAGLTYQGQMVAPDGSRTYWTDDRIKAFLHDVACKEGHPGFMPTPSEAAKHAPNPKTMFPIFTRLAYTKKANISWFELAQIHGLQYKKGLTRVTQGFIKSFVKSLGGALYHLSPAEIYVLFEQQGMTKTGVNRHRDRISDNLLEAIQSGNLPKGEIERWLDDEKGELIDALLNPEIKTVEEAFQYAGRDLKKKRKNKRDNPEDDPYREDVETRLPVPSAGDTLDSLKTSTDLLTQASSDKEAVEFLIAKAADKLWKRCFYDENAAVKEANNHKGNAYSESARDAFIEEYTYCTRLPIPKGYSFVDPGGRKRQPKLMQRLIAYRVFTKGRVLNLSGTGTG